MAPGAVTKHYRFNQPWKAGTSVTGCYARKGRVLTFIPDAETGHVARDYEADSCTACSWPLYTPHMQFEGESPKRAFAAVKDGGTPEMLVRELNTAGFSMRCANNWIKRYLDYSQEHDRQGRCPERVCHVWWDDAKAEWVLKLEGERRLFGRWCGQHQLGLRTAKTIGELLKILKTYHLV